MNIVRPLGVSNLEFRMRMRVPNEFFTRGLTALIGTYRYTRQRPTAAVDSRVNGVIRTVLRPVTFGSRRYRENKITLILRLHTSLASRENNNNN